MKLILSNHSFWVALLCLVILGCSKNQATLEPTNDQAIIENIKTQSLSLIKDKQQRFEKSIIWSSGSVLKTNDGYQVTFKTKYTKNYGVVYKNNPKLNLEVLTKVIVIQTKKGIQSINLEVEIPTKNGESITLIKNWEDKTLGYRKNIVDKTGNTQPLLTGQCEQITYYSCDYIDQYGDGYGCYPINTEQVGDCGTNPPIQGGGQGSDPGGSGSGGGSEYDYFINNLIVAGGNDPISNVADYIKCFKLNPFSQYQVTLFVDQPTAGSSKPWAFGGNNGVDVGHTFIVFQQIAPDGTVTKRAMGLYPLGSATPLYPTDPASLNNDQNHGYDISLSVNINGQNFINILNAFAAGNSVNYNLSNNNCTDWSLMALSAGGINISTEKKSWPLGFGYNPGTLGESVRNMALASNMSRNNQGGTAPSNTGTCP